MYFQKFFEYIVFQKPELSIFKCPIKIDSYSNTHWTEVSSSQSSVTRNLIGNNLYTIVDWFDLSTRILQNTIVL